MWEVSEEKSNGAHPLMNVSLPANIFHALLPGPSRRRTRAPYRYRLIYRTQEPGEPGCALLWEVEGGRMSYQIAVEREETGGLRYHCTCPDAVYRGENAPHVCKHVRALVTQRRAVLPDGGAGSA
jgi:hypothetical protein